MAEEGMEGMEMADGAMGAMDMAMMGNKTKIILMRKWKKILESDAIAKKANVFFCKIKIRKSRKNLKISTKFENLAKIWKSRQNLKISPKFEKLQNSENSS